jgi:hypothetical protein
MGRAAVRYERDIPLVGSADAAWRALASLSPARGSAAGYEGLAVVEDADDDARVATLRLTGAAGAATVAATAAVTVLEGRLHVVAVVRHGPGGLPVDEDTADDALGHLATTLAYALATASRPRRAWDTAVPPSPTPTSSWDAPSPPPAPPSREPIPADATLKTTVAPAEGAAEAAAPSAGPVAPPAGPVAPPAGPVAPPAGPVAPPAGPASPPAGPVAPPAESAAPPAESAPPPAERAAPPAGPASPPPASPPAVLAPAPALSTEVLTPRPRDIVHAGEEHPPDQHGRPWVKAGVAAAAGLAVLRLLRGRR